MLKITVGNDYYVVPFIKRYLTAKGIISENLNSIGQL